MCPLKPLFPVAAACCLAPWIALPLAAEEAALHTFQRQQLSDTYFSEGAAAGDINGDGKADVVYGPYWFEGPEFIERHEIYKPAQQNREGYADHFFAWIHDFTGDGLGDVLTVGFPGTPAHVYVNPGADNAGRHWDKHQVFDWVSNESPQFVDLVGDQRPELVCTRDGFFGFATIDWEKPLEAWEFHPISERVTATRFGHGLGVGDIDGDGRADLIHAGGWYQQPESDALTSRWAPHAVKFSTAYGGAEMHAYDVDGDGDNDVITSHAAHEFGLGWYEQVREGDGRSFKHHLIMGSRPAENRYGVVFSELHSVNLADIDGDGLRDIVTGKTFYSHHRQSPLWDAGAVVYWFRLVRTEQGIDWIPYRADGEAGIGRQVVVADVNGDNLLDIVAGGMKGAHVLTHQKQIVDQAAWQQAQPKPFQVAAVAALEKGLQASGPKSPRDPRNGRVPGAIEGESLQVKVTGGSTRPQPMAQFPLDRWSGDSHLWWTGAKPGDKLTIRLPAKSGQVRLELVLTAARDYGIVQLALDGEKLGEPIDLYRPEVVTTGVLSFETELNDAPHELTVEVIGANPAAVKSYMFGLDYVRLCSPGETFAAEEIGVKPTDGEGRALNLDFETGTLADWTATGTAFNGQPIRGDTVAPRRGDMRSAHIGEYWIGGFEKLQDPPTGTLTSAPFEVTHRFASFLSNGGQSPATRVELVRRDTGEVIYRIAGQESETLRLIVVDLKEHLGQKISIRLVDEHTGHWGHLNFDHFRFHEERPDAPTPPLTQLVADEYPHSGVSAEQAAAAMKLPPGFTVTVGAAEPAVKQPIAMALDDRGRVWIAEAYEYPTPAKEDEGRDRILIFEDTNGDGTLDKRKVFAEGLNLVSGLEVGFGGAWVGAAPYLLFIPDHNGDDVPDAQPQVLLDGWGFHDTHETLNAFIWGPDGWLYGCHGVFTHSLVGKPGTPAEQRTPLNAAIWRYHPVRHEFEVFAHGTSNPWGVDFNDHGQAFCTACVIPHLYHVIQGGRYQRQAGQHFNPHTYGDIKTIADHLHYLGSTPHSGNNKSDQAGGGHAHAGAMIYLGDAWPKSYRNQIFMNNIHGQRLNMDLLRPEGSGYVGGHGPDFLLTGDRASQILNLRYGPDGNAWMIDWYDMNACHHREKEAHDRSNGRIYKISYGKSAAAAVNLAQLDDAALAGLVLHENDWYVRHSRRLLQERAANGAIDPKATAVLVKIATSHADDTRVLRALWALHATGGLGDTLVDRMLRHTSPYVRGWTIQLAVERSGARSLVADLAELAANDPSPVVRLYIASALQRLPVEQRWQVIAPLGGHPSDASDHNLPLMIWYAAEPLAAADAERALAFAMEAGESIPLLRDYMLRRIGSSDTASSLAILVRGLGKAENAELQQTYLAALRTALRGQREVAPPPEWAPVYERLRNAPDAVRLQATALAVTFGNAKARGALRQHAANSELAPRSRALAIDALLAAADPELAGLLQKLVADAAVREHAIRGLAQYDDPRTPAVLIGSYDSFTAAEKRAALATLCSRAAYGEALLNAIERKEIAGADLTADLVRQLEYLKSETIHQKLASVWGSVRETAADKAKLIAEYTKLAESHAEADPLLGRAIFAKTCQRCHILYGIGEKIGPDLTGSNRANLDYLLSNIVDPGAVMAKDYQQTVIATAGGRIVTGIVKEESDNALTLQTPDAVVVIPRGEIEERIASEKSLMPDDQLKQFSEHEIASLISYLRGTGQSPLLATPENAGSLFDGQTLAGWHGAEGLWSVENGEIVGRTAGLSRNEWLVSDLAAADFHFTVEVKLTNNEGNSGIQFRSHAHDGVVDGYQADMGADWWGKLYEEHGRALLWDKSGEEHVNKGDWNTYEIIARGSKIVTKINGNTCVDLDDPAGARRGIFAFQLHSGGKTEVRFRNLKLELFPIDHAHAAVDEE